MKNIVIAILLAFAAIGIAYYFFFGEELAKKTEKNCAHFKTGEFTYSERSKIRIIRNDSVQTEFNMSESDEDAFIDKYYIHWQDECTYYLTLKSTNHPEGLDFTSNDTMWVLIEATKDNLCEFSAFKAGKTFEKRSLLKLK